MSNFIEINPKDTDANIFIHDNLKSSDAHFTWRVKFNTALDPRTVNNTTMYVTTLNQTPIKTSITYNSIDNTIDITPLQEYSSNEQYVLNITKNVKSISGKHLKKPVQVQFKVK